MNTKRSYVLPAFIAALVIGTVLSYRGFPAKNPPQPEPKEEASGLIEIPQGRVLCVVVEEEAIYLGDTQIAFEDFEAFLRKNAVPLRPNYAIVGGTETARYGKVVETLAQTKKVLSISASLESIPLPKGFRRGPIEIHEHN